MLIWQEDEGFTSVGRACFVGKVEGRRLGKSVYRKYLPGKGKNLYEQSTYDSHGDIKVNMSREINVIPELLLSQLLQFIEEH